MALIGVGIGGLFGSLGVPPLRARLRGARAPALALFALAALSPPASLSTGGLAPLLGGPGASRGPFTMAPPCLRATPRACCTPTR